MAGGIVLAQLPGKLDLGDRDHHLEILLRRVQVRVLALENLHRARQHYTTLTLLVALGVVTRAAAGKTEISLVGRFFTSSRYLLGTTSVSPTSRQLSKFVPWGGDTARNLPSMLVIR